MMKRFLLFLLLWPSLALAQGLNTSPPGGIAGKTLASFPLTTSGALIPDDAGTVSHVVFNQNITNYAPQSNTMSTGSGATAPWDVFSGPTISTTATSASDPFTGTWATVASSGNASMLYYQSASAPSFTIATASMWVRSVSGSVNATVMYYSGNAPTACYCGRSDGGACTAAISGQYCYAYGTVTETPVRMWATGSSAVASNSFQINAHGGIYNSSAQMAMFGGAQMELGVTTPSALVPTLTAAVSTRPRNTNYALQSNTMSSGTSAVAPWVLFSTTVTTVAGAPSSVGGGSWMEATSSTASANVYQAVTIPSNTQVVASAWMAKASGTGDGVMGVNCGNLPSACSCRRSDGGACTATITESLRCTVSVSDLGTTPVRVSAITTCGSAVTGPYIFVSPGPWPSVSGTTRFTGAQLEVGTTASDLIPTLATAVTQDRALTDLVAGNYWALNGTVPQVTANPFTTTRYGAGPFSVANYYSLGTGSDVLDATEFTGCAVLSAGAAATPTFFANGGAGVNGYAVYLNAGVLNLYNYAASSGISVSNATSLNGGPNVFCWGRAGSTMYVKANGGTTASGTLALTAATTFAARLGADATNALDGKLYEFYFTTTPWNEASVTALQQRVLGHWDGSSPLTVTRANSNATYLNGSCSGTDQCLWTAPANVARITTDGLLVEPARTNYALQSNTISTGSAATAPWTLGGATVTTPAAAAPLTGTWAEVIGSTTAGSISHTPTTASSTTFVGSVWAAKPSGSAAGGLWVSCGSNVTACSCITSDGSACTATTANPGPTYCYVSATNLGTSPVRISAVTTCTTATTTPQIALISGAYGTVTGTTRFTGAQLEVGTYPTSLIVTTGTSAARNGDAITVTNPITTGTLNWCLAGTYKPEEGRSWAMSYPMLFSSGSSGAANSLAAYFTGATLTTEVRDAGSGMRSAASNYSLTAGAAARMVFCNAAGVQSLSLGGVLSFPTLSGAGTGIGGWATPLYLGSRSDGNEFGGYIKNLKVCKAKTPKECK